MNELEKSFDNMLRKDIDLLIEKEGKYRCNQFFTIKFNNEILKKYGLDKRIDYIVKLYDYKSIINLRYKRKNIRYNNKRKVCVKEYSTLEILKACIEQDTNIPIFLELR